MTTATTTSGSASAPSWSRATTPWRRASRRARGCGRRRAAISGSASDPWTDLESDGDLDAEYDATALGNVVQAARTPLTGRGRHRSLRLAIGFGADQTTARNRAAASLRRPFANPPRATRSAGWAIARKLRKAPKWIRRNATLRRLYDQSLFVLAASEDKLHRGASVASPTMPWVWGTLTLEDFETSGPYHLVWPRDLYHVATAQQIAGDRAGAQRLLDYLWGVQKPDGSFWQNTEVDGTRALDDGAARRDGAADRAVVVAEPRAARATGRTCVRLPTTSSPTGRSPTRSAGRTRAAGRRTRSRPRSPA